MNRNLFIVFFLLFGSFLYAQTDITSTVDTEVESLSKAYQLSDQQASELKRVIVRKYEMLRGIEYLKESHFDQFVIKRRSIYKGTEGSLRLILTKDQLPLYEEEAVRKRKLYAQRVSELKAKGASQEQIIDAGLGIEW